MKNKVTGSSALAAEIDTVNDLIDLLSLEQEVLSSGDTEKLNTLLEKKEKILIKNNENIKARVAKMLESGFSIDKYGVSGWLKAESRNSEFDHNANIAAWNHLLELTDKAQELNRVNGLLINKRSQIIQERLIGIRGGSASEATYGPNGKKLDSVQSRSLVVG